MSPPTNPRRTRWEQKETKVWSNFMHTNGALASGVELPGRGGYRYPALRHFKQSRGTQILQGILFCGGEHQHRSRARGLYASCSKLQEDHAVLSDNCRYLRSEFRQRPTVVKCKLYVKCFSMHRFRRSVASLSSCAAALYWKTSLYGRTALSCIQAVRKNVPITRNPSHRATTGFTGSADRAFLCRHLSKLGFCHGYACHG